MIEKILFGSLLMPGESVRIVAAIIGTATTSYYDVFNNKTIPNRILYAFFLLATLINLLFFDQQIFLFGFATTAIIGLVGYALYKTGQIGGADVIVLASVSFLLPIHPSFLQLPFNLPFIFSILVFSGVLFSIYTFVDVSIRLVKYPHKKPNLKYLLFLIPYGAFVYLFMNSAIFSSIYLVFVSILFISSIFFLIYRESINKTLAQKMKAENLEEEDILALELMDQNFVKKHKLERVLTKEEINRLKRMKIKEIWVFTKMPPFLPFILLGIILGLLFGSSLILSF